MRLTIRTLLSVLLVFSVVSVVFAARAAPSEKAYGHQVTVSAETAVPNVVLHSVLPQSAGYDVICNLSENSVDTSTAMRLGTTVDKRLASGTERFTGPTPAVVLRT